MRVIPKPRVAIMVRLPKYTMETARTYAKAQGMSFNSWFIQATLREIFRESQAAEASELAGRMQDVQALQRPKVQQAEGSTRDRRSRRVRKAARSTAHAG